MARGRRLSCRAGAQRPQALERAFDLLPDAILTDLNIPGIDGYELTRRLKSDPRTASLRSSRSPATRRSRRIPARADRAGCDAVLPKPCDPDELGPDAAALDHGGHAAGGRPDAACRR